ncbi:uncharacterized protein LOC134259624 [Saccostrea cucullata]|uniref:uncharacterized protein LOC134259624 n=1 Tax=Saccostrea cuccullata TaxID=36930 RepID=UPI002ED5FE8E
MDPRTSAQDLIRCDLCETAIVQMHCDICLVNLCRACVGDHISTDEIKDHRVVKYQSRNSTLIYPGCTSHEKEQCEMFCRHCDIPVCHTCLASNQHLSHKLSKLLHVVGEKKDLIRKEHKELNETVYPTYKNMAVDVQTSMSRLEKEYGDLSTVITKHGEEWHKQIDQLVRKLKTQLNKTKVLQLQTLQRHLDEIHMKIVNIKDVIDSLAIAADSNDISTPFSVRSKVERYKKLPQKPVLPVPKFIPGTISIQGGELSKLFGALSSISFQSEEYKHSMKITPKNPKFGYIMAQQSSAFQCRHPVKKVLETPRVSIRNISCLGYHENDASGYSGNTASGYTENVVPYFPGSFISDYPTNPAVGYPGNVASSFPGNVASSFPGNVASSFSGNVALNFPGNDALGDPRNMILDYLRNPTIGYPRNVASVVSDYIRDIALNYPRTSNYPGNVACFGNEMTWLSVNSDIMTLYRFNHGLQVKTIKTKSGNNPSDIAVTHSGDLVYTDYRDGSVNIVNNGGIKEMIRLQYWRPHGVCSTSSGDFLVIMESNENKQARVVRCSNSKEKKSIQFDDESRPLYSCSASDKYICENRNLDICVADGGAKAVVVVNQAGKLKFRYYGRTPSPRNKQFIPRGITTDSQGHILTCDDNNKCVHVINEDGDFIRYISCESLYILCGLCTDTDDNLFLIGYEHISSRCTLESYDCNRNMSGCSTSLKFRFSYDCLHHGRCNLAAPIPPQLKLPRNLEVRIQSTCQVDNTNVSCEKSIDTHFVILKTDGKSLY